MSTGPAGTSPPQGGVSGGFFPAYCGKILRYARPCSPRLPSRLRRLRCLARAVPGLRLPLRGTARRKRGFSAPCLGLSARASPVARGPSPPAFARCGVLPRRGAAFCPRRLPGCGPGSAARPRAAAGSRLVALRCHFGPCRSPRMAARGSPPSAPPSAAAPALRAYPCLPSYVPSGLKFRSANAAQTARQSRICRYCLIVSTRIF